MKKLLATFFAFALVVTSAVLLAGCGEKDFDKNKIKITGTEYVYDGNSHICEITYEDSEVEPEITYSLDGSNYVVKSKIDTQSATTPNEYKIYYKLSAKGYKDYISSVIIKVTPSVQIKRNEATLNYATFADALKKAQNGDEIKLFNDITLDSKIALDKTISIDGQGKRVVVAESFNDEYLFELANNDVELTLKNIQLDANNKLTSLNSQAGTIVLENSTITNGNLSYNLTKVEVSGNTTSKYDGQNKVVSVSYNDSNIVPTIAYSLDNNTFGELSSIEMKEVGTYTLYYKLSGVNGYADYVGSMNVVIEPVVQIQRASQVLNYASFADALKNAENNDEIKLFNDVTLDSKIALDKTISIDGQGKRVVVAESFNDEYLFELANNDVELTLKNIQLDANNKLTSLNSQAGTIVLENSTITNGNLSYNLTKVEVSGNTTSKYDGQNKVVSVSYNDSNIVPTIAYSLDNNTFGELSSIEMKEVGTYTLYYKLSGVNGYADYVGSMNVIIEPVVQIQRASQVLNYATFTEALENAQANDKIVLFDNVLIDNEIEITKSLTIDGQEKYKVSASDKHSDANMFFVQTSGVVLTFKDVEINAEQQTARIICVKAGKLIVDGATLTNGSLMEETYYSCGVYITSSAQFEMLSGKIEGNKQSQGSVHEFDYYATNSSDLWIGANANAVISGGKIGNMFVNANSYSKTNKGKTIMNGGEIASLWVEYGNGYGAEFTYNGGTITKLSVSTEVEGQAVEVTPAKGTTYVGGITEYTNDGRVKSVANYNEFVNAINNSFVDVVKLTQDIDAENTLVITRSLKLDLNGQKLYNSNDLWTTNNCVLKINGENIDVVLTGNGQIVAKQDDCYAIDVKNGNLTIENGTIKGNCSAVQVETGKLTILGGYFEDQQKYVISGDTQYTYTLNCIDASCKSGCANIFVKGGTFVNFNPANCLAEGANTNFVADGYKAQLVEGSETDYIVVAE